MWLLRGEHECKARSSGGAKAETGHAPEGAPAMRPTRITASILVLNPQQGFPAAVQALQSVRMRHSIVHLGWYAPGAEFADVAGRVPTATSKGHVSCQRDVEQTLSEW